jgi:hypothetical protein
MASLYTNENVPLEVVAELRRLGHDVLTSYEAGNAMDLDSPSIRIDRRSSVSPKSTELQADQHLSNLSL